MKHWSYESIFYHIYPLGACNAPKFNDFTSGDNHRLNYLHEWIDYLKNLGINAVYLGPLFESASHGYDTADYYRVDRRLGNNETLKKLINEFHANGIRVVLDGVFNHVGRDFWAFKDVLEKKENSGYLDWFNITFNKQGSFGDPFYYEGWEGHYELVKLNHKNNDVKKHIFDAVKMWIEYFNIDGLRLDVAYAIERSFLKELSIFCKNIKNDFWLMGEMIHGNYKELVEEGLLDSATNYECYKGLYSSHNDINYFEIAYSLNRQFGNNGIYKDLLLYTFADNHDVDRVASRLDNYSHLYPLYCLLFTVPGIPSIYYGSEFAVKGEKKSGDDSPLRPFFNPAQLMSKEGNKNLYNSIKRLAQIRSSLNTLKYGFYRQIYINHKQIVFERVFDSSKTIVIVSSSDKQEMLEFNYPGGDDMYLYDVLNDEKVDIFNDKVKIDILYPNWARILEVRLKNKF